MRQLFALVLMCWSVGAVVLGQDAPPQTERLTLEVWLPDELFGSALALERMTAHTQAFAEAEDVDVTLRLRRVGDVGGIMSTIRAASIVAPDALPTLTLVRRADLVSAERDGLLQSWEGLLSSAVLTSLGSSISLGQIGSTLFGLPFTLDFNHVVYRPKPNTDYSSWAYADVLARAHTFVFVGGRLNQISETFLLQYLVSAPDTRTPDGELAFSDDALRQTLAFYEQARSAQLVRPDVLNYSNQLDYLDSFLAGEYDMAVLNSSRYLALRGMDDTLRAAELPTLDGTPSGLVNGWIWVLVTPEVAQHSMAARYIAWLYQRERYADVLLPLDALPAQSAVLADVLPAGLTAFYARVLANGQRVPYTADNATLTRLFQEALASVITQERTARQATDFVKQSLLKDG